MNTPSEGGHPIDNGQYSTLLVQHGSGVTLAQTEVASKQNQITAAPTLLRDRDLSGTVTTGDALLTQRAQAQQTRSQGGHFLMIVKRNQRQLWEDLELLFRIPAIPADQEVWDHLLIGALPEPTLT